MNYRLHLLLALWFCLSPLAQADLDQAVQQARSDVGKATNELIQEREKIAAERIPLAERLQALKSETAELRAKVQRQRTLRHQNEQERARRAEQLIRAENECDYLLALIREYRRNVDTRLHESEMAGWRTQAVEIDRALQDESDPSQLSVATSALFASSLDRIERRMGGDRFIGTVLDDRGIEQQGVILLAGPLAYFSAADGSAAGLITTRFGAAYPSLEENLPAGAATAITALARGEEARIPMDLSGGDALQLQKTRLGFVAEFRKGGLVIYPLFAVGLLALVLALWKSWDLHRFHTRDERAWNKIIHHLNANQIDEARALAQAAPEPLNVLFGEGIACRNAPREPLEELLHERIIGFLPRLERHLGTMAVLGGIAPLLGLLGTVTGMIHTFQLVTLFGSGDAKLLSGGISEALITTKYGLIIAVPVLLIHAFLARQSRGQLTELEQTALGMINDLKGRPEA